jgi:hypothetical protein
MYIQFRHNINISKNKNFEFKNLVISYIRNRNIFRMDRE